MRPADAGVAARSARPLEKGDRRAGEADLVAEVQVIACGIVEVHRALDEAQPQHAAIKIYRPLRITACLRVDSDLFVHIRG